MKVQFGLSTRRSNSSYAPLAVIGYFLTRANFFEPLRAVSLPLKAIEHSVWDKLVEFIVSVLAGARSIQTIDTSIRPDGLLAYAFGQAQFAQQATVARTLDAFTPEALAALQTAFAELYHAHGLARQHNFRRAWLWLDHDPTGLPVSRHAAGSTRGYFAGKKMSSGANSSGSVPATIMKPSPRLCLPAINMAQTPSQTVCNSPYSACD
jgi:hypothetical protein